MATQDSLSKRLDFVQKDAVSRSISDLKRDGRSLVVMTTGSGKTRVGSKIIAEFPKVQVLWLTQTEELITQSFLDLESYFGMGEVGLYKRSQRSTFERIIVASLQTIEKEENLHAIAKDQFGLIVVDEAHHGMASTWKKVIDYFDGMKLGLTATPVRGDGLDLSEVFGSVSFDLGYEDAKALNLIAHEEYRVILTNSQVEGLVTRTGEYTPAALDRLIISQNRNEIIVDSYKKYGRSFMRDHGLPMKAICFCITVSHAIRMRDLFLRHNIKAEALVSRHSRFSEVKEGNPVTERERREVYQSFLDGVGPEILCVVNVLNEGKNVRDVGCLLMARPTRSSIIYSQQMGRGCRRIEGKKEKYLILDYVDLMRESYPPMTLSRLLGKRARAEEIVTEYYRGKDPIVVDQLVEYLSPSSSFYPEQKWTKERVSKALLDFYKLKGRINRADLVTKETGLPNQTTISRYWGSVAKCFLALGIPEFQSRRSWTKEAVVTAIRELYQRKGKVLITDLQSRFGMPSKRIVIEYWGSWKACLRALGFLKAPQKGVAPIVRDKVEPRGVWRHRSGYAAAYWYRGKRYYLGFFDSVEKAEAARERKHRELAG